MQAIYNHSILGGTFDRFHLGHQKLINTAFEQSEQVTIGLTMPVMYKNKLLSEYIQSYSEREENLKNYLKEKNFLDRSKIIPISDIYGTALTDNTIQAIFATEENLHNVNLINIKRKEINLPDLEIKIVPYVNDDNGEKITSEKIRKGEIDRNGFVYRNLFDNKILKLPDDLRSTLQKPIGKLAKDTQSVLNLINKKTIIIAVGDIIVSKLKEAGVNPAISVIDLKTRRHDIVNHENFDEKKIINDQGTINNVAVENLQEKINVYLKTNKNQVIVINGEEDLLALPAILLSPLGSIVLYGQFDMGIVMNFVDEELKNNIKNILEKFEK